MLIYTPVFKVYKLFVNLKILWLVSSFQPVLKYSEKNVLLTSASFIRSSCNVKDIGILDKGIYVCKAPWAAESGSD